MATMRSKGQIAYAADLKDGVVVAAGGSGDTRQFDLAFLNVHAVDDARSHRRRQSHGDGAGAAAEVQDLHSSLWARQQVSGVCVGVAQMQQLHEFITVDHGVFKLRCIHGRRSKAPFFCVDTAL